MADAELTLTGFDEAIITMARVVEAANPGNAGRALTAGGLVIQNLAKTKVKKKTNTLGRSIHIEDAELSDDAVAAVAIGTDLVYAAQVEFGGTIKPKTKKMLAWKDSSGKWIFAKSVTQKARPYLRPALAEGTNEAIETTGRALETFFAAIAA